MNSVHCVLGAGSVLQQNRSLHCVRHLCIVIRVVTIELLLISEHKSQCGMQDRKKSAFREYMHPVG
jgi:hypothetical protein